MSLLGLFLLLVFCYALVSRRLERTVVTAPIVFTTAGLLVAGLFPGFASREGGMSVFLHLAEVGLVMLLFTDASRTDLRVLRCIRALPIRLLSVGMLLTLLLGTLGALWLLPGLTVWEAGILAAILAPTDAGLGQIIVNSPRVPMRIRQALNVEAGLNDGLSVPFLMFFMALAVTTAGAAPTASLGQFVAQQLGCGSLLGLGIGLGGGWLLALARRNLWMTGSFQKLGLVALPLFCLLLSEMFGASMFIAAFVGGLAVQVCDPEAGHDSVEFTEDWGQLLNLSVFFLFGLLAAGVWTRFDGRLWLYALLSLTVVRMVPVALALWGTRLSRASVLFMGWFGPRGLASIVLGLVYLEHAEHTAGQGTIQLAVMLTVLLSIFAHGLSATPGIELYARAIAGLGAGAPEREASLMAVTVDKPD